MIYTHCLQGKTAKEVKSPLGFLLLGMVYAFIVNNGFNLISGTVSSS